MRKIKVSFTLHKGIFVENLIEINNRKTCVEYVFNVLQRSQRTTMIC